MVLLSCSSIPLSSYWKLASVDPLTAEPGDIRVAVRVLDVIDLNRATVKIVVSYAAEDGSFEENHDLVVLPTSANGLSALLEKDKGDGEAVSLYQLTGSEAETLRRYQQRIATHKDAGGDGTGTISVSVNGLCASRAITSPEIPYAIYLKTSPGQDFFRLLNGDLGEMFADQGMEVPICETWSSNFSKTHCQFPETVTIIGVARTTPAYLFAAMPATT